MIEALTVAAMIFLFVFLSENHFLLSKTCMKSTTYHDRPDLLEKKKKKKDNTGLAYYRFEISDCLYSASLLLLHL